MLIFLILAAQFESWLDPLVVICTVPLALAGALLSLWIGGHTINIFSQIGGIVLIGLVTKNGILIVEFANQRKEQGLKKLEAVVDAAGQRFRPILMTSLATVLGVLPIALSADGRRLAVSVEGRRIQVWDINVVRRELAGLGLDWPDAAPTP